MMIVGFVIRILKRRILMHNCVGECSICEVWVDVYMERKKVRKERKVKEICAQVLVEMLNLLERS